MSLIDRRDLSIARKDLGIMKIDIEFNRHKRFGDIHKGFRHNEHRD